MVLRVHPIVKGACGVAVLCALGAPPPLSPSRPARAQTAAAAPATAAEEEVGCPAGAVPVGGTCLPLPAAGARADALGRRLAEQPASPTFLRLGDPHRAIPRLPERSERWADYQLPIDPFVAAEPVDDEQGKRLAVRLLADADAPVTLIDLERQSGRPEVVLVGQHHGITVVIRHEVESPQGTREYLVFYGNLARPGPGITTGARLGALAVLGFLGGGDAAEPHVELEVRQPEHPISASDDIARLVARSVAVDPRNVLPRKGS
jgi:hypothetical protein